MNELKSLPSPAPDVPEDLAELLALWWRFEQNNEGARLGFNNLPEHPRLSVKGYRGEEASEGETLALLSRAIGDAVERLPRDEYAAAGLLARHEATGHAVWVSPSLPADGAGREALFARTVRTLSKALILEG